MVTEATEWPIMAIEIPNTWAAKSGKTIILGDAAHAMTPYMALGAAMAVEDASALVATLSHLKDINDLPLAISNWTTVRKSRTEMVHEASFAHGLVLHLEDGPVQIARDEAMKPDIQGTNVTESPNQWTDPTVAQWAYNYDAATEIHRFWEEVQEEQKTCAYFKSHLAN
jgi:salicylate hydroxylase